MMHTFVTSGLSLPHVRKYLKFFSLIKGQKMVFLLLKESTCRTVKLILSLVFRISEDAEKSLLCTEDLESFTKKLSSTAVH